MFYFRGIDPEDLLRESKETYPVRTAMAYAIVLDGVLQAYSAHKENRLIRRILHARSLFVSGPHGRTAGVPRPLFIRFFKKLFSNGILKNTQYPQEEADRKYRLEFEESDNSKISLFFGGERLYYGQREYYDLNDKAPRLTAWLDNILGGSSSH